MKILLVATYELGQQPGAVGGAAAYLRAEGHEVQAIDVSVDAWDPALVDWADEVAFSVPMHTATRLARDLARGLDKPVHAFGLYAEQCHDFATPVEWDAPVLPSRDLLPPLDRYARLVIDDEQRLVGSVLASHGCAHRCRHCPVPVVFDGRVRRVDEDAVLADIAQLVAAGARHITFGDPDFLNAPPHSRRIVAAMHERFPDVTFDCTVKVEHVIRHADVWPEFAAAGCVFVVSAFESVDDAVLARLDKGHVTADAAQAVAILRDAGIEVRPSWMPFTPWTTRDDVVALLDFVHEHDLVGSVDPVQYSVRLLLPEGSLLLDHADLVPFLGPWDPERSTYTWAHPDPAVDELQQRIAAIVESAVSNGDGDPVDLYARVREAAGAPPVDLSHVTTGRPRLERELVLLRRTHRAPTHAPQPDDGRRAGGLVRKLLLAHALAPALAHALAPAQARPIERHPRATVTPRSYRPAHGCIRASTSECRPRSTMRCSTRPAESGRVSLNTFAVQALAAAAGPEFLRDVRAGGKPATVADEQRVLVRPERMKPIVDRYVTYWVDRLGIDQMTRVIKNSKDHDKVWAWYVGREAELAELAARRAT